MHTNNCKRLLAVIAMVFCMLQLQAQRPVISVETDTIQDYGKFGPNRLYFLHAYAQFGLYTPPNDPGLKNNWWSLNFTYGLRNKIKICSWDALVFDFAYRYDRFSIDQNQVKALPLNPMTHQRERISVHNLNGVFCNRLNFGRRGNILGVWMDLGVYGDWVFRTANVYVDQYYDSNSQNAYQYKSKTKARRLAYINDLNYGLTVRAGYDYAGLFASYRMSELIQDPSAGNYGDMPRLMIGIEFYMREE